MIDNPMPRATKAEAAVLGSVLIDPRSIIAVMLDLTPGDFYESRNAAIYQALLDLHSSRTPIDWISINDKLERDGNLEKVGGAAYLASLANCVPSALNIESYAAQVIETATRRKLLDAAAKLSKLAFDADKQIEEAIDEAETTVYRIRRDKRSEALQKVDHVVSLVYDQLQYVQETGESLSFSTGYAALDYKYKLRNGEFSIIAARTSIGKTALLVNMAHLAARRGKNVLIFSLEMTAQSLVHRLAVSEGRVTVEQLSSGKFPDSLWPVVAEDLGKAAHLPLWIDDTPSNTMPNVRAQCLRFATNTIKPDAVFIDYIQLMRAGEKVSNRYLEIGVITRGLKAMAKELDCPVIAAAQLGRRAEDARPTLADLRESGDQEQDADNVLFIHRPREIGANGSKAEIIIAKQRQGPVGSVDLWWDPKRIAFKPIANNVYQ